MAGRHWKKLAEELQLDPDETIGRVAVMADQLSDATREIGTRLREDGLAHETIQRLVDELPKRAEDCLDRLERE